MLKTATIQQTAGRDERGGKSASRETIQVHAALCAVRYAGRGSKFTARERMLLSLSEGPPCLYVCAIFWKGMKVKMETKKFPCQGPIFTCVPFSGRRSQAQYEISFFLLRKPTFLCLCQKHPVSSVPVSGNQNGHIGVCSVCEVKIGHNSGDKASSTRGALLVMWRVYELCD